MTINGGIFLIQQVYNRQVSKTWPITAPGITTPITDLNIIDEGNSLVVNVGTVDYEGQTLYWTISGVTGTINSSDFTAISGSFTVEANNFGYFTITSTADVTTEGTESFVVQIRTNSTSGPIKATTGTITINDTSLSPTVKTHGYWVGGPVNLSKTTFASDTATAVTRIPSVPSVNGTSGGNFINAYHTRSNPAGTPGQSADSRVYRFTFANDTSINTSYTNLSTTRYNLSSANNNSYMYFCGGGTGPSPAPFYTATYNRLDFANDSITVPSRNNLSTSKAYHAGVQSISYAWTIAGQVNAGGADLSRIDRIDFSNDNTTASTRTNLPVSVNRLSALSGMSFGYIAQGASPVPTSPSSTSSRVYKLSFSNDTSIVTAGPLSVDRWVINGSADVNYGWFGGGQKLPAATPLLSRIDRIDFSNDGATASVRGPMVAAGGGYGAVSGSA
jgi:hypothetical protein